MCENLYQCNNLIYTRFTISVGKKKHRYFRNRCIYLLCSFCVTHCMPLKFCINHTNCRGYNSETLYHINHEISIVWYTRLLFLFPSYFLSPSLHARAILRVNSRLSRTEIWGASRSWWRFYSPNFFLFFSRDRKNGCRLTTPVDPLCSPIRNADKNTVAPRSKVALNKLAPLKLPGRHNKKPVSAIE